MSERVVLADPAAVARAAADRLTAVAASTLEGGGLFRLGLAGGRTPEALYRLLASPEYRPRVDWDRVQVWFSDERDVPPTEPESNYWWIRKILLEPVGVPPRGIHRMKADAPDLEAAASAYEAELDSPLDFLILGIGEDGHTASLFPGSPLLEEGRRRVAAVYDSPKPPERRMTLTPLAFTEAGRVMVLATGLPKAEAVAKVFTPDGDPKHCPARILRAYDWVIDQAAASRAM